MCRPNMKFLFQKLWALECSRIDTHAERNQSQYSWPSPRMANYNKLLTYPLLKIAWSHVATILFYSEKPDTRLEGSFSFEAFMTSHCYI